MSSIRTNKGKWTREEHDAFVRGVEIHGRYWDGVASMVPTRTLVQIRTHAQKYFAKIEQGEPFPDQPYPSQYSIEAGQACVHTGAYAYSRRPQQGGQFPGLPIGAQHERGAAAAATTAAAPARSANRAGASASFTMPPVTAPLPPSAYGGHFEKGNRSSSGGGGGGGVGGGGGGGGGVGGSSPDTLARPFGFDGGHAGTTSFVPGPLAPAWGFAGGRNPPSPPGPESTTTRMAPPLVYPSSFALGGRAHDGAGLAWDGSVSAGKEACDERGAQGGGGGLQRRGGSCQGQQKLGTLAPTNAPRRGVDRMRSGIPGVEQQQREQQQQHRHNQREMQLQRLLLEDDALDESDAAEGRGQPAPEGFPHAGDRMVLLSDDGSLVEIGKGEFNELGTL